MVKIDFYSLLIIVKDLINPLFLLLFAINLKLSGVRNNIFLKVKHDYDYINIFIL